MNFRLPTWRTILPHVLALSLLVLVWGTAWSAFHQGGKERSWWWSNGNDACQGTAAQSASMRLGAPIQTVVWPGATLSTAYLYANVFTTTPALPMSVQPAEALLSSSVQFHWAQAGVYGLSLLLLVYALGVRWSGSPTLTFVVSGLLATNNWFLFGLFHVRAEIPSLVFALAGCWWAIAQRPRAWPIARAAIFGLLMSLAVLSKIQVAPVVLLSISLFATASRDSACPTYSRWWVVSMWSSLALSIVGIACMVRTSAIDDATYALGVRSPTFAHVVVACSLAVLVATLALARSTDPRRRSLGSTSVLMLGGAALALILLVMPNAYHGGLSTAIVSANRIAYGVITFGRYGEGLPSAGGWGVASSILDYVRSFVEFQTSSGLISGNLMIWAALFVLAGILLSTLVPLARNQRTDSGAHSPAKITTVAMPWKVSVLLFWTAVLCDATTTLRTNVTTSYAFYHIYSLPFYLLAAATAVGQIGTLIPRHIRTSAPVAACSGVAILVSATLFSEVLLSMDRVALWREKEATPADYFAEKRSVWKIWEPLGYNVAPEFGSLTGQTYQSVREYVLQREAAQSEAAKAKAASK